MTPLCGTVSKVIFFPNVLVISGMVLLCSLPSIRKNIFGDNLNLNLISMECFNSTILYKIVQVIESGDVATKRNFSFRQTLSTARLHDTQTLVLAT